MINKINPLYILAFFITLVLVSYLKLSNKEYELEKKSLEFKLFKNEVQNLQTLKNTWEKNNTQNIINSIKSLSKKVEYKDYKSKIVLTLNTQDSSLKEKFVNKVLNSKLKIERFDIKEQIIMFEVKK